MDPTVTRVRTARLDTSQPVRGAGGQVTHGVGSGEAEWSPGASVHQHDPGVAGVGHRRVGGLGVGRYTSSTYMSTMRKETNEHQPPGVQKS